MSLQFGASFATVVLVTSVGLVHAAPADGAATDPPAEPLAPSGNFLSAMKQSMQQDIDKEVVRGHFDAGTPPDAHRYYCLVNEKTGKREEYGVAGELQTRRDGMTGVKSAAVSFFSCSTAEADGMLVTTGYLLTSRIPTPSPAAAPVAGAPAAQSGKAPAGDIATAAEVKAAFARFVTADNAQDQAALSALLWDSKDFQITRTDGTATWGLPEALESFQHEWQEHITLTPPLNDLHIATPAPDVAILVSPLLMTRVDSAPSAAMVMTWNGVFVKTRAGWRIASIVERSAPK